MKNRNVLVRVGEEDYQTLKYKSLLFGTSVSEMMRSAALSHWSGHDFKQFVALYKDGDESTKKLIVDVLFNYYRRTGYPHNELTKKNKIDLMQQIASTKSPLLDDAHLQVNPVGIALCNHYHPHMMKVKCLTNFLTPYEQYSDDTLLKDAINRVLELDRSPNHASMRKMLRTRDGVRSVVNFKPAIARYIYETYCPTNGSVLDPCAGYSGRLAGLISTRKNLHYHGIDPSGQTVVGGASMAAFFGGLYDDIIKERTWPFAWRMDMGCAEDILPTLPAESYDLSFTSPPYFDVEKYDTRPNQSYIRYKTYDEWRAKFLFVLVEQSARLVKKDGYVILNVKNYKKAPIVDDVLVFAQQCGLILHKTYSMRLANSEFHLKKNKTWHSEPIFVFKK